MSGPVGAEVGAGAELVDVHLLGLSLPLRARFVRYNEGLLRELTLIRIGEQQAPAGSLPERLLEIAAQVNGVYAPFQARVEAAMDTAAAAGRDFCDVTWSLPATAAPVVQRVRDVLEEADEFCRDERHLLTLPAPQELVAYRRWFFGEVLRQLAGRAPRPWHTADAQPRPAVDATAGARAGARRVAPAHGQQDAPVGAR
ncbi:hypothetical protein GTR00_22130, partial [Kineococcus sp. T90]